jgi:hypothetical protein
MVLEPKRQRDHNVTFNGDGYDLFVMAEGALVVLVLERFLTMILGSEASEKDTMQNLLEKVLSNSRRLSWFRHCFNDGWQTATVGWPTVETAAKCRPTDGKAPNQLSDGSI